jgi:hypothetical protein
LAAKLIGFSRVRREPGRPKRLPDTIREKGAIMRIATVSKSLVLGLAVLLAASAFAATKADLQLEDTVKVNGTTLKPGEYKVQWEGSGSSLEVSILQGKNVVAKAPGHFIELQTPSAYNAAVTVKNASGPDSLVGIRFQGKKMSLELGETSAAIQQSGSSQ